MGRIFNPGDFVSDQQQKPSPDEQIHDKIGLYIARNRLKPTPQSYAVAHAIVTRGDLELVKRINQAQERWGLLDDRIVDTVVEQHRAAEIEAITAKAVAEVRRQAKTTRKDNAGVVEISAAAISKVAEQARAILSSISAEVGRSGEEARGYADGLQVFVDGGSPDAADLVALTLGMIERTREAEARISETASRIANLQEELIEARSKAAHDPLTGLPNRRTLDATLKAAAERATAAGTSLAVAIVDIDHFKSINDTYGHPIGDQVIKVVGQLLTEVQGDTPFVGRYGGEEFVMVFDGITPEAAAERIDGVRAQLEAMRLRCGDTGKELNRITFCAGVAGTPLRKTSKELLESADKALYRAKHDGRNLVRVAGARE